MDQAPILILGSYKNKKLTEALNAAGLDPIIRGTMMETLGKIRHDSFAGIVIDRDNTDVDLLEFVFNVRDYKPEIPIIVVGKRFRTPTDQMVQSLPGTTDLGTLDDLKEHELKMTVVDSA